MTSHKNIKELFINIGNRTKKLIVKNKVNQEELSKALQVSTQAVSKWGNG